jgi:hypothetical protein
MDSPPHSLHLPEGFIFLAGNVPIRTLLLCPPAHSPRGLAHCGRLHMDSTLTLDGTTFAIFIYCKADDRDHEIQMQASSS